MAEVDGHSDPFELAGTTIEGKYRVEHVVGDGGFGVVYRGVHGGFGEPIAVKCLKLPRALDDEQRKGFLEQLREEGRLLHRLSKATPGIVQALDVGALTTSAGVWVPYLVLEWLEGDTLADHLAKRRDRGEPPYGLTDAIRLLEPAMRALAVAHAMKVAHRDVKPHNLFVTKVGGASTMKVLDFGIAKVVTDYPTFREALAATQAKASAFTPRYGAPEQFNKARGPSGPWTDVFALGLIFIELVTGEKALEGDDPTQLYVAAADPVLRPSPRGRGVMLPDAVEAVIAKAIAVEPTGRYPDAGELCDALLGAAGLAPASIGVSSTASTERLRARTSDSEARTIAEAKKPLSGTEPTEVAPGNAPPGAPAGGPRAAKSSSATPDSMSETPFFDRHQLPPSRATKLDPAPASTPAPTARRWWIVPVAVLVIGGGSAAAYVGLDLGAPSRAGPHPSASGIRFTTPVLPTQRTTSPTARARSNPSAMPSGMLSPPSASTADMVLVALPLRADSDAGNAAHGFYLDRTEVTVHAYDACVSKRMCPAADRVSLASGAGDRWGPESSAGVGTDGGADGGPSADVAAYVESWSRRCNAPRGADDHPINCVDFASAEAFCRWSGKRLPTDAEWEVAARGASNRPYPWGDEQPSCGRACYDKNGGCREPAASVSTCAAGAHPADRTPEGIYDLAGDVAEWTSTSKGALRVVRGGSFIDGMELMRAATRADVPPALAHVGIGFRCALDGEPKPR